MFYIKNNFGEYLNKRYRETEEENPAPNEPQHTFEFNAKEDDLLSDFNLEDY